MPEPDKTTTVVAVTVTVHCVTSAQVIKASEILSTAVGALALDGINARMKVQPHEPNRHQNNGHDMAHNCCRETP